MNERIIIVGNSAETLVRFRASLIRSLSHQNTVFAACPDFSREHEELIKSLGATPVQISVSRFGMNPFKEFLALSELVRFFLDNRITVCFSFFLKPIIYCSIASFFSRINRSICMVEGLGYIFTSDPKRSLKLKLIKLIMTNLLRVSLPLSNLVVFLNRDDKNEVEAIVPFKINSDVLGGIGVDLEHFFPSQKPGSSKLTFLFVGRILKEKGIVEYIRAAQSIKTANAEFWIAGGIDSNPGSISEIELKELIANSNIRWLGQVKDIRECLSMCDVFVLPSYREGLPRSTQEAMAMGKAVITTDVEGCRDTVLPGKNGIIVKSKCPESLADAFRFFIDNPEKINEFGINSRKMAETFFCSRVQDEKLRRVILGENK